MHDSDHMLNLFWEFCSLSRQDNLEWSSNHGLADSDTRDYNSSWSGRIQKIRIGNVTFNRVQEMSKNQKTNRLPEGLLAGKN